MPDPGVPGAGGGHRPGSAPPLEVLPLVHVDDVAAAVAFYRSLGGEVTEQVADGDWAVVTFAGGRLGLLGHPPNPAQEEGAVELTLESPVALADVEAHLRRAGVELVAPIADTVFGQQLMVRDPGGRLVKINRFGPPGP